jgi:hypothetical protein
MTLHQFNALKGDGEKLIVTLSEGEWIARREVKNFKIDLYDLFSFYVEIWPAPDVPGVLLYKSFVNTTDLAPYLNEIDISELTKT